MALDFPWAAALRLQSKRDQPRGGFDEGMQYGSEIGNVLGGLIGQQKQKTAWSKTINELVNAPGATPQMKQFARFLTPQNVPELIPGMMKQQRPPSVFRPFPGMMSEGGEPLVIDEATGQVRPAGLKAKSTQKGPASDLGEVSWEKATPDEQQLAIALYNGNIRPYDLGYRERSKAVVLANEYASRTGKEPYLSFGGDVKAGVGKAFGSGKPAMNVLSLNTAIGHAGTAMQAYNGVQNTNQRWLNVPLNKLRTMTNDPNIVKLGVSLNALQGELATVFKGSGGTDQEIGKWQQFLSQDLTPTQAKAAIPQVINLLKSRQEALESMRSRGQSNRPTGGPLLSPHASDIISQMQSPDKPQGQSQGGWSYVGPAQ